MMIVFCGRLLLLQLGTPAAGRQAGRHATKGSLENEAAEGINRHKDASPEECFHERLVCGCHAMKPTSRLS
jgi:hypothetical protein